MDAGLIARARAFAAEQFTDTCTIVRPGAPSDERDPVTGEMLPTSDTPLYTGSCRLKTVRTVNPVGSQVGGDFPVSINATFSIPVGAAALQNLDVVTVTGSDYEPWNVGKRFRLTTPHVGSQRSADRWQFEVITG